MNTEVMFGVFDGDSNVTHDYADTIDGAFERAWECILAGADNISIKYPCVYSNSMGGYMRDRNGTSCIVIDATEFNRE